MSDSHVIGQVSKDKRLKSLTALKEGYSRSSAKFMAGFSYDIKHDPTQSQLLGVNEEL